MTVITSSTWADLLLAAVFQLAPPSGKMIFKSFKKRINLWGGR